TSVSLISIWLFILLNIEKNRHLSVIGFPVRPVPDRKAPWHPDSQLTPRRYRFFSALIFFSWRRFSFDAFVGFVALRFFRIANARDITRSNLAITFSRLASCDRFSWDERTSTPSAVSFERSRSSMISFSSGVRRFEFRTSNFSVTFVLTLLTCWPPGPPLRDVVKRSSGESFDASGAVFIYVHSKVRTDTGCPNMINSFFLTFLSKPPIPCHEQKHQET